MGLVGKTDILGKIKARKAIGTCVGSRHRPGRLLSPFRQKRLAADDFPPELCASRVPKNASEDPFEPRLRLTRQCGGIGCGERSRTDACRVGNRRTALGARRGVGGTDDRRRGGTGTGCGVRWARHDAQIARSKPHGQNIQGGLESSARTHESTPAGLARKRNEIDRR